MDDFIRMSMSESEIDQVFAKLSQSENNNSDTKSDKDPIESYIELSRSGELERLFFEDKAEFARITNNYLNAL